MKPKQVYLFVRYTPERFVNLISNPANGFIHCGKNWAITKGFEDQADKIKRDIMYRKAENLPLRNITEIQIIKLKPSKMKKFFQHKSNLGITLLTLLAVIIFGIIVHYFYKK